MSISPDRDRGRFWSRSDASESAARTYMPTMGSTRTSAARSSRAMSSPAGSPKSGRMSGILGRGGAEDGGAVGERVAVGAHAVGRLGSVEGKKVLVLGAGPIGNLTAQAVRGLGAAAAGLSGRRPFPP